MLVLHYSPTALQFAINGAHPAEARDEHGNLVSLSWDLVEQCCGEEVFSRAIKIDYYPFAIPYGSRAKPELVFKPSNLSKVMKEWHRFLKELLEEEKMLRFVLGSKATQNKFAKGVLGSVEKLNEFYVETGRIFSTAMDFVATCNHPEWFFNKEYGKISDSFKEGCEKLDELYTKVRKESGIDDPCTFGKRMYEKSDDPAILRMKEKVRALDTLGFLIANYDRDALVADTTVNDESEEGNPKKVPNCIRNYLEKNKDEFLDFAKNQKKKKRRLWTLSSDLSNVKVWMLHRFMCSRGGTKCRDNELGLFDPTKLPFASVDLVIDGKVVVKANEQFKNWGQVAWAQGRGLFDPTKLPFALEDVKFSDGTVVKANEQFKNWGQVAWAQGRGLFDPTKLPFALEDVKFSDGTVVKANEQFKNWGQVAWAQGRGIFDPTKLPFASEDVVMDGKELLSRQTSDSAAGEMCAWLIRRECLTQSMTM